MRYRKTGGNTFKFVAEKEEIEDIAEIDEFTTGTIIAMSDYTENLKAEICNTEEFMNYPSNIYFELIDIKDYGNFVEGQFRYLVSSNDIRLLRIADDAKRKMKYYDCPKAEKAMLYIERMLCTRRGAIKSINAYTQKTSSVIEFIDDSAKILMESLIDKLDDLGIEIVFEGKVVAEKDFIPEKAFYFDSLKAVLDATMDFYEQTLIYKLNKSFVIITTMESFQLYDLCTRYDQLNDEMKKIFSEHALEIASVGDVRELKIYAGV